MRKAIIPGILFLIISGLILVSCQGSSKFSSGNEMQLPVDEKDEKSSKNPQLVSSSNPEKIPQAEQDQIALYEKAIREKKLIFIDFFSPT